MALQTKSISANGSKGHHKLTLTVTEESTSTANNTSSISWSFKLSPISSGWDWNHTNTPAVSYTVTINGTKYTGDIMKYDGSSTVTVKSGTATISHNADGDKTISYSFSVTSTNYSYLVGSASASGSMALTTIPRQAKLLTASNFTDSTSPKITYSNPAGTAVSELKAGIFTTDGQNTYVAYRDISKTGSSYTFTLTDAEKQKLLNACSSSNSISVRFYIRTELGGNTYRHYLTKTFSVGNANPIVTGTVVDTNQTTIDLTGNSSKLIRYYSNAKATMTATAQKGAAIDESLYIIRNGNNSAYSASHTFNNVESNTFTFQAEDSRGNIGTDVVEPDMIPYIKPTCNIVNNRPDAVGNMTVACSGSYFKGSFGAVENELTVQYRYKATGGTYGQWTDMDVTPYTNSYYASASFSGLDQMTSYTFQTRVVDKLATVNSTEYTAKSTPIFHWGENDFVFEVPVTFNAGAIGTDEVCKQGTWTPTLSSSAVSSYSSRYGWYKKVGDVVSIGFYVKVTCNSGYETTSISISGLPYTPLYPASGGGMCSGAYVSAARDFQCFVIESRGVITTRVQACNNTSAANLSTSASGCFYRSGGGDLTLSGTIVYMAKS